MNRLTLISGLLFLSLLAQAEPSAGPGYPPTLTDFKKNSDAVSDGSLGFENRDRIEKGREKDIQEMEARNPIFYNGKLIEERYSGIDKATIAKAMETLKPKWAACYRALPRESRVRGKVNVAFQIAPRQDSK